MIMKNVNILKVYSEIHSEEKINSFCNEFLSNIFDDTEITYRIVDIENLYDKGLPVIFVLTGGSEPIIKKYVKALSNHVVLLTYNYNNSLPASLEILTYLKTIGKHGEILHGSNEYILKRLKDLMEKYRND